LKPVAFDNADDTQSVDSRIAPAKQLVRRFLDACESGGAPSPGVVEGYRVQCLIEAARCAHASGRWIDVAHLVGYSPDLVSGGFSKP
jgi:predicted dehydrogenase